MTRQQEQKARVVGKVVQALRLQREEDDEMRDWEILHVEGDNFLTVNLPEKGQYGDLKTRIHIMTRICL